MVWPNTANYSGGQPTKKLKVKVTWSWVEGSQSKTYTKESSFQTIEVKHIGTVGTITINGSGYATTANLPCGTGQLSVSVPGVFTEPAQNVEYYWTLPANWSLSGPNPSSTPQVTITPTSGTGGTLKVEAKRVDSNVKTSNSLSISRQTPPIPTISSYPLRVCSGSTTVSASSSGADHYIWIIQYGALVNGATDYTGSGSVTISGNTQVDGRFGE